ncbi:helix-turn-helix domain-containing protein [Paenibacillus cisolokensis]|uniref:AraC family transcriptional regulator n=1 Tax=Paenibacillus cisolokensis TaxID=1658519 RepID=UPI003D2DD280
MRILSLQQLKPRRLFHRGGKYYRSSLIMMLVVSAIPGLITAGLLYWMAGGRLEAELLKMHHDQIEQRAANINEQLSNLELMLAHWAFDPKFDYSLSGLDFKLAFERSRDITKTLLVMQGSNTMVKQVELYLAEEQPILFNPEYGEIALGELSRQYGRLLESEQSMYWTEWAFDPKRPAVKELTLVHHIPGGSQQPFGALLIRMDPQKVAAMLRTMTPYNDGETFLVETGGELFASASGSGSDGALVTALRSSIAERETGSRTSFFMNWDGATYTVTYGSFSRIAADWNYVSAAPISSITMPVVFISKLIFAVSTSALIVAGILSWLASRKMYSPVRRLLQQLLPEQMNAGGRDDEFTLIERQWQHLHWESHDLQRKLTEQLPHVKESFLHQLLLGYLSAYSEQELRSRMAHFKWTLDDHCLVVMYIQLSGMTRLDGKFQTGDEGLVSYASANIVRELAEQQFGQSDVINFHDLTAGLLLILPSGPPIREKVLRFGGELTDTINRILRLRVTAAFSPPVTRVSEIPLVFEAAQQAASHRLFGSDNQLIDMSELDRDGVYDTEPRYSFTLERELIQALRTGQREEAFRILDEFLAVLGAGGAKAMEVQQGMLHLLGSVQHAMMVSGIQPGRLFKGVNMYEALSEIREPELIGSWFREKVVSPYMQELADRADGGVKMLIEQAMIYMQQHYMQDISLDSCADHIGTNPFFLSKAFKQVTGKNFIDYLTGLRMDKAKELLRDTGMRICDVAGQVGYQHSYFNRIFKKQEGITPTQYRELSQYDGMSSP